VERNILTKEKIPDFIHLVTDTLNEAKQENNPKKIDQIATDLLCKLSNSDYGKIFLYDHGEQALYSYKDSNSISMIKPIGILGESFLTKEAQFYNHIASEKVYNKDIDNPNQIKLRSQLVFPVIKDDKLVGIAKICRSIKVGKPYSKSDIKLLASLNEFLLNIMAILTKEDKQNLNTEKPIINKELIPVEKRDKPQSNELLLNISNTVHDIRTPANALRGFLELIEEKIDDKEIKEFIINAKESATLINQLTDTILEQSKEGYLYSSDETKVINTVKFLSQITNSFSAVMQDKNIEYTIYIDPNLPKEIKIDDLKLRRVIINLIGNAYKFTPKDKSIHVDITYNNKKIKVQVSDTGIGIEKDAQEKIFEKFKQVEDNGISGGTGLGLPISAMFVKELGGTLKLDSEIEKGSKFYFDIPVLIENSEPSYTAFENLDKYITILTNNKKSADALNIKRYLHNLGMPEEKIAISNIPMPNTTHLFCFQHKLSEEIASFAGKGNIKTVILEESLFSIDKSKFKDFIIAPLRNYYGDCVHDTVYSRRKKRILVVDDNKVNISLLKSMMETEHVDVSAASNGEETLDMLLSARADNKPYDILFIDKHMPKISGTEVVKKYRDMNKGDHSDNLLIVSITGDPNISEDEKELYDAFITKPFSIHDVRKIIKR